MRGMSIDMTDARLPALGQLRAFLDGTVAVAFSVATHERCDFVARTLRRFGRPRLKRADKGVVLRLLARVIGHSRQPLARLVGRVRTREPLVECYRTPR